MKQTFQKIYRSIVWLMVKLENIHLITFATYIALGFAVYHIYGLRKTEEKLEYLTNKLVTINENLPTRSIGEFPDNMVEINKLIRASKKEIMIVSDVVCYGQFSNPSEWDEYQIAIANFIKGNIKTERKISILVHSDSLRKKLLEEQFTFPYDTSEDASMKEMKSFIAKDKGEPYQKFHTSFYNKTGKDAKVEFPSMKKLYNYFLKENRDKLTWFNGLSKNIDIRETNERQEVFLWIADSDQEAVFSIPNKPTNREVSFITYDKSLIDVFKVRAEVSFNNAPKVAK